MTHLVTFDLTSASPARSDLRDFLDTILPETRAYQGCEGAEFVLSEDASDRTLLIEKWQSKAAFEAYMNWRIERGDYAKLRARLVNDPTISHFTQS